MFERIVCGVDGSDASLEAVRQADVLVADGGRLVLVVGLRGSHRAHLLGSVSHHVARAARCSVLVVRDEPG